jgi:hypothetical protein
MEAPELLTSLVPGRVVTNFELQRTKPLLASRDYRPNSEREFSGDQQMRGIQGGGGGIRTHGGF